MESRAKGLENIGNYKSAVEIYSQLLKESNGADDKYFYSKKIEKVNKFFEKVSELNFGEAFFPVFDGKNNSGAVFTIHFEKSSQYENGNSLTILSDNWGKIQPFLKSYLDEFLEKNLKHHYVFDWKFGEYFPFIKNIPSNKDSATIFGQIEGNSLQLALAFAFFSAFLKVNLGKFVFSGNLEQRGNSVKIGSVNEIPTKLSIIKKERPSTQLIANFESDDKTLLNFDELNNAINRTIPAFAKLLDEELFNNSNIRKISLKVIPEIEAEDGKKHDLVKFDHGGINTHEIPLLYEYLKRNKDFFSPAENGVIIDGLKPAFGVALIAGMEDIKNTVSNFIAIRNTQDDSKGFSSAVVVKSGGQKKSRNPGELFKYKI